MILACFVLGLSTRKVAAALLPLLGWPVGSATVSAVAKHFDAAVAAFYRRPLKDQYRVLVLDGVALKRKTRAGALARPVLVALGLRPDGKKEVIDFRLTGAESAAQWEQFLGNPIRRGSTGERLEMLCVDGGSGLLAALPTAFPTCLSQLCWAHKIRNVLNMVRTADQAAIKADLHRIMNAPTLPAAWPAARRFADRWGAPIPWRSPVCVPTSPICSPASADRPSRAQARAHHKRHRAALSRGSEAHPPDGHLPGQDLDGPSPVRRVHAREPQPRPRQPLRPDANLFDVTIAEPKARGLPDHQALPWGSTAGRRSSRITWMIALGSPTGPSAGSTLTAMRWSPPKSTPRTKATRYAFGPRGGRGLS
jgi:Transposase, Mutator family